MIHILHHQKMHENSFCFKILTLTQDFEVLQVNTFFIFPFLKF
ncbi:hypothetical protein L313_2403 [Acinetobacter haemolyticus CIP 64.3 = MTCC 9819]|nr:hypothetical protein L313_2403 [Acinetobacter haemolyticus CIP 64.3 = MTCC 9819]